MTTETKPKKSIYNDVRDYPPRRALLRWYSWEYEKLIDNHMFAKEIVAPTPDGKMVKFKRTGEMVERDGETVMVYVSPFGRVI